MAGAHTASGRIFRGAGFDVAEPAATHVRRQKIALFRHHDPDGLVTSMTYFTGAPGIEPHDEGPVAEPAA